MKTISVLYDISALGTGHVINRARAGIFRVVEHGAHGLFDSEECVVIFCASQCNSTLCQGYLELNPVLSQVKLSLPDDIISNLYNFIEPIKDNLSRSKASFLKRNILRKIYQRGKKYTRPLADSDLKNIDIYHSPIHPMPAQVLKNGRIKKFQTIHDLIPLLFPQYFTSVEIEMTERILAALTGETFVICVSHSTKKDLLNLKPELDPDKIFVIPLAAGEQFKPCTDRQNVIDIKKKYGIPEVCRYILSVSTLEPRKNIDQTIRSFIRITRQRKINDLCLVLAGAKGWDYGRIFSEIEGAAAIQDKIILTGYVPDEDLSPLYSGAMAFVYPSFYEGFGLPPLEAMQCGTPVITSNTSSLPEVVGDAGIMVDPTDSDALDKAILDVYSNESFRSDLVEKSICRAFQFSWERNANETILAYKTALRL